MGGVCLEGKGNYDYPQIRHVFNAGDILEKICLSGLVWESEKKENQMLLNNSAIKVYIAVLLQNMSSNSNID